MGKLVIHVGAHKTGTTSIQHLLSSSTPILKQNGLTYLTLPQLVRRAYTSSFYGNDNVRVEKLADLIANHIDGADTTVLSWEGFLGPIMFERRLYGRAKTAAKVLERVGRKCDLPVEVCLYIRRQDTFSVSAYIQASKEGFSLGPDQWLSTLDMKTFDWCPVIHAFEDAGLRVNVGWYECIYDSPSAFLQPIFGSIGFWIPNIDSLPRQNKSYSERALKIQEFCNREVELTTSERKTIRKSLESLSGPSPSWLFDMDKNSFINKIQKLNLRLSHHYRFPEAIHDYYCFK